MEHLMASSSACKPTTTTPLCVPSLPKHRLRRSSVAAQCRPHEKEHRHLQQQQQPKARSLSAMLAPTLGFAIAGGRALAAVSYDDVVSAGSSPPALEPDQAAIPLDSVDLSGIVDSVLGGQDAVVVVAGAAAVALPLLLAAFFFTRPPKPFGSVSAKDAFSKLQADVEAQLLDIRELADVKAEGNPDLRSLKKKVIQIPFSEDQDSLLKKLLPRLADPSTTTLYILDQFDGNSISVAKYLTSNGIKAAYAIKGGAEGSNGWRTNELPWILPRKSFSLDINSLKDVFNNTDSTNLVPATLGIAAAAGLGFAVFSEAETALQLLGSAALVQIFVKKLLFAKDREKTLQELASFLDTKVAPKELVDELKSIGQVYLEKSEELATGESSSTVSTPVLETKEKPESVPVIKPVEEKFTGEVTVSEALATSYTTLPRTNGSLSPYIRFPGLKPPSPPVPAGSAVTKEPEAKPEPAPVIKSVEEKPTEVSASSPSPVDLPQSSRPLSPYTQFPGLKPPSPPVPSGSAVTKEPEAKPEPAAVIMSVEEKPTEVSASSPSPVDLPQSSRPLSPYTQFPGLKPPSPPVPSRA